MADQHGVLDGASLQQRSDLVEMCQKPTAGVASAALSPSPIRAGAKTHRPDTSSSGTSRCRHQAPARNRAGERLVAHRSNRISVLPCLRWRLHYVDDEEVSRDQPLSVGRQ
jgi:hypothetical protein